LNNHSFVHHSFVSHSHFYIIYIIQQLLKEAQSESIALQATNTSLRDEVATVQSRLERTTQALRISSDNAAKDRADLEAADATAASLAQALQ
jgi:hypothetical protein